MFLLLCNVTLSTRVFQHKLFLLEGFSIVHLLPGYLAHLSHSVIAWGNAKLVCSRTYALAVLVRAFMAQAQNDHLKPGSHLNFFSKVKIFTLEEGCFAR